MSTAPVLEHFTVGKCCVASLPIHSASKSSSHRFFPLRPTSIRRLRFSCSSSSFSYLPSSLFLKKDKNPSVVPLVARTSGWVGEDNSGWSSREVSDGDSVVEDSVEGDEKGSYPELLEEAKLFVGNLPYDIDSEKLAHLFEGAGVVEVAEVIYNRETERSRGFGFITMSTVEEAEKAVEKYNQYDYNGRFLTVNNAARRGSPPERSFRTPPRDFEPSGMEPSLRVYVGNLPWQVDDSRLEQLFSEHGKVTSARVVCDRDTGRSRGFGFVTLASKTELEDAISALDGQTLDGRAIRVNVAEERSRRGSF